MIELQQLRVFVRIAELSSFTKAAVSLGVTQPNISHTIKHLESSWGGQLFYRTGRGVTLSEFGEHAIRRAKVVVDEADRLSEELRAFKNQPSGNVSVGLPHSLVRTLLPALLNQLRREAPSIRLSVYEAVSDHQVVQWLAVGDIDVGVASRYKEGSVPKDGGLVASPLVLAAPARLGHLASKTPFSHLSKYPLVLPAAPSNLRLLIDSTAKKLGVSLNVVMDANSVFSQRQACDSFDLYMISAQSSFLNEPMPGSYIVSSVVNPFLHRSVTVLTTQQRPLSRAAREIVKRITPILRRTSQVQ